MVELKRSSLTHTDKFIHTVYLTVNFLSLMDLRKTKH